MWAQYKKTFVPMQIMILVGCICIFFIFLNRHFIPTLAAFVAMQVFAIVGASWGVSLKARFDPDRRRYERLPLE